MTEVYKIESGIPIPKQKRPWTKQRAEVLSDGYPFTSMNVGDSFLYTSRGSLEGRAGWWGRKLGRKFISRTVTGGYRMWRVK